MRRGARDGLAVEEAVVDLLSDGIAVARGKDNRYGRQLVVSKLADGRDVGAVLMRERLAQP